MATMTQAPDLDTLAGMLSDLINGAVEVLDISPDLYETAVERYEEVGTWLAEHGGAGWEIYPQGSFLLGTVVRPARITGEYDIDLVSWLPLSKDSISQKGLKDRVGGQLMDYVGWKAEHGHTDGPRKIEPSRRCWTLGYDQFHMDVLPAIADEEHPPTGIRLTDKKLREWQRSNPKGYAAWFRERSRPTPVIEAKRHPSVADVPTWRVRNTLQRVVQVLKWHCMITFENDPDNRPPSILITTLAARAYAGDTDLFTAIRAVLDGMPRFVDQDGDDWWVPNPAHEEENLADKWNEYPERREAFYRWFGEISRTIDDLAQMEGKGFSAVSSRLLESFGKDPMRHSIKRVAADLGALSGVHRMGASGELSASSTATGPRAGGNIFYGQHPVPRG